MRIKRQALKAGYVLAEDIYSKTARPIIRKNTVISEQHLEILEAFLIEEVLIETKAGNGDNIQNEDRPKPQSSFVEHYLSAVNQYKKIFSDWQSGDKVAILKLRQMLIPLLEEAVEQPNEIFSLHFYVDKPNYLYHHAVSTAILSALLAKKMSYQKGDWVQVGLAGALCDCGMARISPVFLKNKGTLTSREREEMRQHPVFGYQMLRSTPALKEGVPLAVSQHHERLDGSGYPLGIKGNQMHAYSKIVAVADSFHAMTCDRPYRAKRSPFQVLEVMRGEEFGRYDVQVLNLLTGSLVRFSVGTKVRLTDNQIGEIVFISPNQPTRPMVRLDGSEEIIALADRMDLSVDSILS